MFQSSITKRASEPPFENDFVIALENLPTLSAGRAGR
jgi:hypothetical protein